jgi:hypothetical protein
LRAGLGHEREWIHYWNALAADTDDNDHTNDTDDDPAA